MPGESTRADRVLSIAATVTAVIALCVAVWDGSETRRHNRLSVAPRVDFFTMQSLSMERPENYLSLHNRGLGPAVLKSLVITVNGERISLLGRGKTKEAVKKLGLYRSGIGFTSIETDDILEVGDSSKIFQINTQKATPELLVIFNSALSGAKLEVEYESLYGEKYRKEAVVEPPG